MKKYILTLLLIVFVIPSIALASWWNPFSWKIFNRPVETKIEQPVTVPNITNTATEESPKVDQSAETEKLKKEVEGLKKKSNQNVNTAKSQVQNIQPVVIETWEELETKYFADANQKNWIALTITSSSGEKRYYRKEGIQWIRKNTEQEASQPLNTTLCNGKYWNNCTTGKQFYCPASGDAQCNSSEIETLTQILRDANNNSNNQQQSELYKSLSIENQQKLNANNLSNTVDLMELSTGSGSSLGRNKGEVVFSKSGCDYYIVETSLGYSLLEWYGGFFQYEGDIIYGNLNSYGFKDIASSSGRSGRVWIEDWMLSESRVMEKYYDKCD